MSETEGAKYGRPRNAQASVAILDATAALLLENGFARLSVEAIAARAGVSKATIYRRWGSRDELLHATMARIEKTPQFAETGDLRSDLQSVLRWMTQHFVGTQAADIMPLLVAEAQFDPTLHELKHTISEGGRNIFRGIFEHALHRDELHNDMDIEAAIDMLIAPIFIRKLISDAPISSCVTDQTVDMLLIGIAKPPV